MAGASALGTRVCAEATGLRAPGGAVYVEATAGPRECWRGAGGLSSFPWVRSRAFHLLALNRKLTKENILTTSPVS